MYKSPYDRDKCYKTVTGEGAKEAVKDGSAASVPAVPSPPSPGAVNPGTVVDGVKKLFR